MSRHEHRNSHSAGKDRQSSGRIRIKSGKKEKKLFEEDMVIEKSESENEEKSPQVSFDPPSIALFGETELLRCSTHRPIKATKALSNKVIGIYFSAGWCPPCVKFTPLLRDLYNELKQRGWPFEVVFVSCDKTEEKMNEYLPLHGDWLYVPFQETIAEDLKERYDIRMVPRLIIIKESGDIVTATGRKEVTDRGISSYRVWLESAGLDLHLLKKLQRLELIGGPEALQGTTPENTTEMKGEQDDTVQ